jgi:hypothetical protein
MNYLLKNWRAFSRIPHTAVCGSFKSSLHAVHEPSLREHPQRKLGDRSYPAYKTGATDFAPHPARGERGLEFGHFPEGDFVLQPRVAVLGYPGKTAGELPNPNGVAAKSSRVHRPSGLDCLESLSFIEFMAPCTWSTAATPLGLRGSSLWSPKVAEYSNLGLWATTTTWLIPN